MSKESKNKDLEVAGIGAGTGAVLGTGYSYYKPGLKQKRTRVTTRTKKEFIKKLRPGDVLLEGDYHTDAWSKGLQTTIRRNKPEYHSAIYTGKGQYAELLIQDRNTLIKDTGPSKDVIKKDLMYALGEGSHEAYRPKLTKKEVGTIAQKVNKSFPKMRYSTPAAIRVWAQRKIGLKNIPCKGKFCSNSVASVLPKRLFKDVHPSNVMPTDFVNNPNFTRIGKVRKYNIHMPASNKSLLKYVALPALAGGAIAYGVNKLMSKKAEHVFNKLAEDTSNKWPILGAGALAAGLGVAALTKKPRMFKTVQKEMHWVTDAPSRFTTNRTNIIDKAVGKVLYGDTKFHLVRNEKELSKLPKKLKGAVYYDLSSKYNKKLYPKADVAYNKNLDFINKTFQNKINYSKLKSPGTIPKGDELHRALKKPRSFKQFVTRLSEQKNKYVKPSSDYGSARSGHLNATDISSLAGKKKLNKTTTNRLQKIYKNRRNYVIQDAIDPKYEQRVDVLIHKGKVTPIKSQSRWWHEKRPAHRPIFEKQVAKQFARTIKMNPAVHKATKKDSFVFGIDVIKDKKNKLHFVDVNDQSGFIDPATAVNKTVAHTFRKKIMNLPDRSHILKGVATTGLVGSVGMATN